MERRAASGEDSLLEGDSEQRHFYGLFDHASKQLITKESLCEKLVSESVQRLRSIYAERRPWQNENFKCIDFNKPGLCCAYLQRYASCHAALSRAVCSKVLEECEEFEEVLRRRQLHILSVGGGPGNDLLGFCSAMNSTIAENTALQLTVSDLCNGWEAAFQGVVQAAKNGNFGDVSNLLDRASTATEFVQCDLFSDSSRTVIETADIIIMTKVLSSVAKARKEAILERIFRFMKAGAIVVYIDINAKFVAQTARKSRLSILFCLLQNQFVAYPRCPTEGITKCTYEVCVLQKALDDYDEGNFNGFHGPNRRLQAYAADYDDDDDDDNEETGGLEELEEIDQTTDENADHDVPECKCDTEHNFDDILEYY